MPLIEDVLNPLGSLFLLSDGTLTLVGDTYTLVLPYQVNDPEELNGISIGLVHTGVVVATAVVPEPGTWVLAIVGFVAFIGWKRKTVTRWRGDSLKLKPARA